MWFLLTALLLWASPAAGVDSFGTTRIPVVATDQNNSSAPKGANETTGILDYLLKQCIAQAIEKDAQIAQLKKEIDRLKAEMKAQIDEGKKVDDDKRVDTETDGDTILIMGGKKNDEGFSGMTVLSSDRSRWTELKLEIPHKTWSSGAVYLNGELYLIEAPKALYKLEKNLTWIQLADMNVGRFWITNSCFAWNGYIWVFGGMDLGGKSLKSVERYDPTTDKWTLMPDMKHPRSHAAAVLWSDSIIISGGYGDKFVTSNTVECFNLKDESWKGLSSMRNTRRSHSLVEYKNKLIMIAGLSESVIPEKDVWEFDPLETNATWAPLSSLKYASESFVGAVLGNEIYVIGGQGAMFEVLNRVEIFDGERWRDGPPLPYSVWGMASAIIPQKLAQRLVAYRPT